DRVAWFLTFIVPVVFFSIFALIFGGQSRGSTPKVKVAVVDEDGSDLTQRVGAALQEEAGLRVQTTRKPTTADPDQQARPLDRESAEPLVRDGDVAVAIILPNGMGKSFARLDGRGPAVELLADTSDPVAPQMVGGLLQKVVMTAAPDLFMESGIAQLQQWG